MDYAKTYETYLRMEKGHTPRTIAAYLGDVRRFRIWLDAHPTKGLALGWEEVRARHLRAYLAELEPSAYYVRRIISSLTQWFDYLVRVEELMDANPAAELSKPKLRDVPPPALSTAEVAAMIQAAYDHARAPERTRN